MSVRFIAISPSTNWPKLAIQLAQSQIHAYMYMYNSPLKLIQLLKRVDSLLIIIHVNIRIGSPSMLTYNINGEDDMTQLMVYTQRLHNTLYVLFHILNIQVRLVLLLFLLICAVETVETPHQQNKTKHQKIR